MRNGVACSEPVSAVFVQDRNGIVSQMIQDEDRERLRIIRIAVV